MNIRLTPRILQIVPALIVLPFTACAQTDTAEWQVLFDGETLDGWKAFRDATPPEGWQVVEGAITRVGGGGDLVSVGQYGNFELRLEWNI